MQINNQKTVVFEQRKRKDGRYKKFDNNENNFTKTGENLLNAWNKEENKVFVLKSKKEGNQIRDFYQLFLFFFWKNV